VFLRGLDYRFRCHPARLGVFEIFLIDNVVIAFRELLLQRCTEQMRAMLAADHAKCFGMVRTKGIVKGHLVQAFNFRRPVLFNFRRAAYHAVHSEHFFTLHK
jgi:hypothetical protein